MATKKQQKGKWVLCLLAVLGITLTVSAQKSIDRVHYRLQDDFETGELYGWEPYPYSQDIGYDALYFARSSPTLHNSRYALARPVKASDATELYQGFTKRLDMYTTPDTRLRAAFFFQSDRNPQSLELSLGTFDGRRYLHTVLNPEANRWVELDFPAAEFLKDGQPLPAGEHIQVVTIKATYPMVYYLYTYTILMDDFSLNGERQRQFIALQPTSTNFDKFTVSILNKHFFYGDTIALTTAPEGKVPLQSVRGTLVDSRGHVVKDNIPFVRRGDAWSNPAIHRLTEHDAPGQWELALSGQRESGQEVHWRFRFLMPGKKITDHPRLFFSSEELKKRLASESSPIAKNILDKVLSKSDFMKVDVASIKEGEDLTGDNLVGGPYSKTAVGFNAMGKWLNPMSTLGKVIEEGSFRYAFTGDTAAGTQARKALLKLCSFSKWNNNWMLERKFWTYYPVGYALKQIAYGYDMLHDLLTPQERDFVREAIINKGLKLFYRDMVEMNRMPSNMTNHIAVIVAGHGLAATAIYGDDPDNPYLEPYLSGILTKAKTFIDRTYYEDGSYGEPKSGYMDMATRDIAELLAAVERNFGVNYSTTTNVQNFYKYPLQASHSSGLMQSYGDGERAYHGFTQEHAEWFVHRTGNPYLYSYLKPYWEAGNGGYLGYLWYRSDIKPLSREALPASKVFKAQGMVMRSGWNDTATVITTRVGPNSNHYHYDQGSFQVMTNGMELLTDPGIGTLGYYANLDYLIYDIQAIGHNVLLVDHDPESQVPAHYDNGIAALKDWPHMVHTFSGELADAVASNLAGVYKDKLKAYTRTLLYTKTGPLFVFDQVKSKSPEGHVYDWLFHAPQNEGNKRSINYSDGRMTIERPGARLTMDVVTPEIVSGTIRDRNDKRFPESYLVLSSRPGLAETNFLAVILPEAKPLNGTYAERPKTSRIDADGWTGARVTHSGGTDLGLFRVGAQAAGTVEGFTTDAGCFTASFNKNGSLTKIYFEGTSLSGKELLLRSGSPVTLAVALKQNATQMEVQSPAATLLTLRVGARPSQVLLDKAPLRGWRYDAATQMLTLPLPEGRHDLSVPQALGKHDVTLH